MIFLDIYKLMSTDVIIKDYLQPTKDDSKIYPNQAKLLSKPPYIIYRSSGVNNAEIISEESMTFIICAEDYFVMDSLSSRVGGIFNEDSLETDNFNIYHIKKTNSQDSVDELGHHARSLTFAFKFRRK